MKIFKQLILIIAFTLLGVLISYLLSLAHINFPGSLIGMILLFIFLLIGIIKVNSIDEVERITNTDFFSGLDDKEENRVEAECNLELWP